MSKNDTIYVVGGTLEQARMFVRQKLSEGFDNYVAVCDLRELFGKREAKLLPVGGFYTRSDWYEWELRARHNYFTMLDPILEF